MAVEWNSVDVALFKTLPRCNESLLVVVEAKQKDLSCLNAKSQAQSYAEQGGRESCCRLIVTDGIRYGVYSRTDGKFRTHPDAYLNITRMREKYPLLNCRGAKDAFLGICPQIGMHQQVYPKLYPCKLPQSHPTCILASTRLPASSSRSIKCLSMIRQS